MSEVTPDFIEKLAKTNDDPSAFSELVFGTPLHSGQQRYAANAIANVNFLLPGNSWGKTEFICRFATYLCWFKKGPYEPRTFEEWLGQEYKALIASYNYPIAKESWDRFVAHHNNRPTLQALVAQMRATDPPRITFSNGAILDWGSLDQGGKLVEAARRRAVLVDEVGHIPDISYTFDNILFPRTMGVGGRIHLLGTPKAHSDPYLLEVYEKGRHGDDPFYYSQDGSVLENEFWPRDEQERIFENPRYVRGWEPCPTGMCDDALCRPKGHPILTPIGKQVILGYFIISGGYFFNRWHTQKMFSGAYEVKDISEDHFHVDPIPGHSYIGAWDLGGNRKRKSKKKGSDATVGFVLDITSRPWTIARYDYIRGGDADWQMKYEIMEAIYKSYSMPYLLIDTTGQIDSVEEALQQRGVEVEGVHFGGNSSRKFDMLRSLQLCMEMEFSGTRGLLRSIPIPKLLYELDHYVIPDDDIEQDTIMALAMAVNHAMMWEVPAPTFGDVL